MRVTFDISRAAMRDFQYSCEALLTKVGNGSRKALVAACNVISGDSLNQVPRDTETLALSQFWEVDGYYKTGFRAVIGYGGNGDPINPKTGMPASSYMVAVHEDLSASHPIGKAKFLEDPIRNFAMENFPRTAFKYIQDEILG